MSSRFAIVSSSVPRPNPARTPRANWLTVLAVLFMGLLGGERASVAAVLYVQGNSADPSTAVSSRTIPYTLAQAAGNLNVVAVSWGGTSASVSSVTDTKGNTYALAVGPTALTGFGSASIYYAKNIVAAAAGTNSVTVIYSASVGGVDIRIAEYSGLSTTSPVDVTAASTGTGALTSSGSVTTTNANDLLVGSNATSTGTSGSGSGFTQRIITPFNGNILEDEVVSAVGSYAATAPMSPSGNWIMQMVAFKAAGSGDTTAPSVPTGLQTTSVTSTQVNLSWTASTDNVGVTGYLVERCLGAGCTTFTQPTGTTYSDTGLVASTTYLYRVRAADAAGNLSGYSNTLTATTSVSTPITYRQGNSADPSTAVSSRTIPYTLAQTAGNLNVVAVSWGGTSVSVSSVTDTKGNTYTLAVGPTALTGFGSASIYYAKNIVAAAAGTNSVTVTYSASVGGVDIRIAEYSGLSTTSPVDVTAASTGSGTLTSSGSVTTINANDLLVGSNATSTGTSGSGTGFTSRIITGFNGNILEDEVVTAVGPYAATAPMSPSGNWIMQMVAFKAASGDISPPSVPAGLTVTAASSTQINLNWSASNDNVGVTSYVIERCPGATCSNFQLLGNSTGTTYSDTGLSPSTSYTYHLKATDAAGNGSAFSSSASVQTSSATAATWSQYTYDDAGRLSRVDRDTGITSNYSLDPVGNRLTLKESDGSKPSIPGSLALTAISPSQVNLTWAVATDNVGVTGYVVSRCTGGVIACACTSTSCPNFTTAVTVTAPAISASDTGLTSTTTYYYVVRAQDAVGNISDPQLPPIASIMTLDGNAPSVPTLNVPTIVSAHEVDLSWSQSNDDVGVTGYAIERCVGTTCTTLTVTGSPPATTYHDTGVVDITNYRYRVRAYDARNNYSGYSNAQMALTPDGTGPTPAPSGLTPTALSSTTISLTWTGSSDNVGVTLYSIERCLGAGCSNFGQAIGTVTSPSPPATTYVDSTVAPSTTYVYRVRAQDAALNWSGYSAIATGTSLAGVPGVPSLTPVNRQTTSTSNSLVWTASAGATSYQLFSSPDGTAGSFGFLQSTTQTQVTLTMGTGDHFYKVEACNTSGCSAMSNTSHILVCSPSGCP